MKKIYLDAREMEHPEPLEKAIAILRGMERNSCLYMIHRKNPVPLIALAEEHGLNFHVSETEGEWHIIISAEMNMDLGTLLEKKESS